MAPLIEHTLKGIHFTTGQWPLCPASPTVVFIHGVANSSKLWKNQVKGLSGNMNVVAIDLPGHGESIGKGMDRISDYAGAVAEFIKAIKAPYPIPCGLSMGGAITLQMLMDERGNYQAGIIINSGVRLKVMPAIFDLIENDYQEFALSLTTSCISAKTNPAKLEEATIVALNCDPNVVYKDFIACDKFDITDSLQNITVPLLVLTAEEDRLTPPKFGRYMVERVADAQLAHIMEAGHMSPLEKPEEVNRVIYEFINKKLFSNIEGRKNNLP